MLFTLLMVLYVVLAVFMIGFILIQRGAGAAAGSGFGGGASATVFGARGAASFLTKATKWLAIAFFLLTLGMAIYVQRTGLAGRGPVDDLGVMSSAGAPPAPAPAATSSDVPTIGSDEPALAVPADEAGPIDVPVPAEAPVQAEQDQAVPEPPVQDDEE